MTSRTTSNKPIGRRPGDPEETKRAILAAARHHFGAVGFERATIRNIAQTAEVDPALVIHHFTNKQQLFVRAHDLPIDPTDIVSRIAAVPVGKRGRAFAQMYLDIFVQPGSPALSMLRAAATNDDAARMMREFINSTLISNASKLVPGSNPELRMALIGSQMVGVLFTRELLQIEQLVTVDTEALASLISPAIQNYFSGSVAE